METDVTAARPEPTSTLICFGEVGEKVLCELGRRRAGRIQMFRPQRDQAQRRDVREAIRRSNLVMVVAEADAEWEEAILAAELVASLDGVTVGLTRTAGLGSEAWSPPAREFLQHGPMVWVPRCPDEITLLADAAQCLSDVINYTGYLGLYPEDFRAMTVPGRIGRVASAQGEGPAPLACAMERCLGTAAAGTSGSWVGHAGGIVACLTGCLSMTLTDANDALLLLQAHAAADAELLPQCLVDASVPDGGGRVTLVAFQEAELGPTPSGGGCLT